MFTLRMNPASEGDALVLTWGTDSNAHHAVVDLGRIKDYRLNRDGYVGLGALDLLVISHVDADHIEGAIPLVAELLPPMSPADVWYNGHHHLLMARDRLEIDPKREPLGAVQGEKLSMGIKRFAWPWNEAFDGGAVSVGSVGTSSLSLRGGLHVKLLSPDDASLAALIPRWERELAKAGLRPHDPDTALEEAASDRERLSTLNVETLAAKHFRPDTATPNGSSIAFIAEFEGKRVLLAADAHPHIMVESLRALGFDERTPCKLACYKVSHHGSRANTSPELLRLLDCTTFGISTDGSRHGHPDPEFISRILMNDPHRKKTLAFNNRHAEALIWNDPELMKRHNYRCLFPKNDREGLFLDLRTEDLPHRTL
jgi:beta-lactamase superfamily II metal-dependent hydrolase